MEAGLDDDLGEGLWTVFAPNNDAFDKADLSGIDDVSDVLLFHTVANDKLLSGDLECSEVRTLSWSFPTRALCVTNSKLDTNLSLPQNSTSQRRLRVPSPRCNRPAP